MDLIQEFEKKQAKRKIPYIKPGDTIKVHQKIQEGDKQRIQIFEGVVIKIHRGFGINGNVTVRKISSGVGVEKTFPFHLPSIEKIEVVKRGKVRRAKLYYLRKLQEKAARLKEEKLTEKMKEELRYDSEAEKKDADKGDKGDKSDKDGNTSDEKKPQDDAKKEKPKKDNKPADPKDKPEKKEEKK